MGTGAWPGRKVVCNSLRKRQTGCVHPQLKVPVLYSQVPTLGQISRRETRVRRSGALSPRVRRRGWGSGCAAKGGQEKVLRCDCAKNWVYLRMN